MSGTGTAPLRDADTLVSLLAVVGRPSPMGAVLPREVGLAAVTHAVDRYGAVVAKQPTTEYA